MWTTLDGANPQLAGVAGQRAPNDALSATRRGLVGASPTVLVALVACCIAFDLVSDVRSGEGALHLAPMIAGSVLSIACLVVLWRQLRASHARARTLEVELDTTRADVAEWRAKAAETLGGLASLIDRQFDAWGLSPAERAVGLLLLKGFSMRQIADERRTTERTARQQALLLYRKARLAGRAELAAFFLQDLLLPTNDAAGGTERRREATAGTALADRGSPR